MPTYEFACKKCGKEFTLILSMKERETAKITCSACGSEDVSQILGTFTAKTSRKS